MALMVVAVLVTMMLMLMLLMTTMTMIMVVVVMMLFSGLLYWLSKVSQSVMRGCSFWTNEGQLQPKRGTR